MICTEDHPILTDHGWKSAGTLTPTDLICLCPIRQHYPLDHNEVILDSESFKQILSAKGYSLKKILTVSQKLQETGLLPLAQNQENASILARIFAYTLTNGSTATDPCHPTMRINFKTMEDGLSFLHDLRQLHIEIQTALVEDRQGWFLIDNNPCLLSLLMIALGIRHKFRHG